MKLIVPAEEIDAVNWIEYLPSPDASGDREFPNYPAGYRRSRLMRSLVSPRGAIEDVWVQSSKKDVPRRHLAASARSATIFR